MVSAPQDFVHIPTKDLVALLCGFDVSLISNPTNALGFLFPITEKPEAAFHYHEICTHTPDQHYLNMYAVKPYLEQKIAAIRLIREQAPELEAAIKDLLTPIAARTNEMPEHTPLWSDYKCADIMLKSMRRINVIDFKPHTQEMIDVLQAITNQMEERFGLEIELDKTRLPKIMTEIAQSRHMRASTPIPSTLVTASDIERWQGYEPTGLLL